MPYVKRENGKIVSESRWPMKGHTEKLSSDDADVMAFRQPPEPPISLEDRLAAVEAEVAAMKMARKP